MKNKILLEIGQIKAQIASNKAKIKQVLTDIKHRASQIDNSYVDNKYNKDYMLSISFGSEEYFGLVTRLSNLENKLDLLKSLLAEEK